MEKQEYAIAEKILIEYSGNIIVPMTLYKKDYFDGIIGELRRLKIPVSHIQLKVSKKTIIDRLTERSPALKL